MRKMKLSDIKISSCFATTTPTSEKMEECREHWNEFHRQDRYIVVDRYNMLIDGYVMYLVLKENNIEEAEIKIWHCKKKRWYRKDIEGWKTPKYRNEPTTYVYGKHLNSLGDKEYVWRIPKSWTWMQENLQMGDTIACTTKCGISPVVVTKIETLDLCPVDIVVKRVARKEIRRNGVVVE